MFDERRWRLETRKFGNNKTKPLYFWEFFLTFFCDEFVDCFTSFIKIRKENDVEAERCLKVCFKLVAWFNQMVAYFG